MKLISDKFDKTENRLQSIKEEKSLIHIQAQMRLYTKSIDNNINSLSNLYYKFSPM